MAAIHGWQDSLGPILGELIKNTNRVLPVGRDAFPFLFHFSN